MDQIPTQGKFFDSEQGGPEEIKHVPTYHSLLGLWLFFFFKLSWVYCSLNTSATEGCRRVNIPCPGSTRRSPRSALDRKYVSLKSLSWSERSKVRSTPAGLWCAFLGFSLYLWKRFFPPFIERQLTRDVAYVTLRIQYDGGLRSEHVATCLSQ